MMVQGETLMTGATGCTVYSPWFEGCGSGATFAVEVGARTGGSPSPGIFEIQVETKISDDADSAATTLPRADVEGAWLPVSAGLPDTNPEYISSARYSGFKELVRFKYLLATVSPAKFFSVHFRMLPPLWQSNCLGCSIEEELVKDIQMET